jgi:threonyl-tRNA synthetase
MLEEAKKRDHRKIGREGTLLFRRRCRSRLPLWLPRGTV